MIKMIFSNNYIKLFLITIFLSFSACSVDPDPGRETYFVLSDGARLPVYITGPNTQKVVLFVHGGPATSSVIYSHMPIFNRLSKKFRFVFWDQRAGGGARGHVTEDSMNLAQFVKDMDAVYQSVIAKYPSSKIYVMGHSFGGFIGGAYTSKYNHKVQASIFGAPAFNLLEVRQTVAPLMLDFINNYLKNDLSSKDRKFWEEAKQFYTNNPVLQSQDLLTHFKYAAAVDQVRGTDLMRPYIMRNLETFLNDNVLDSLDLFPQIKKVIMALGKHNTGDINLSTDPTYTLSNITTPMLMFTGALDLTVPEATSIDGFNALNNGTANASSKRVTLSNTAHSVLLRDQEIYQTIVDFINNN